MDETTQAQLALLKQLHEQGILNTEQYQTRVAALKDATRATFGQRAQTVTTQVNVAGDYYAAPTQPSITITGDGNVVGDGNTVQIQKGAGAPLPADALPVDVPALRVHLRRLDGVEIESLCLDHFPEVYDKFARGLQRGEMINLLLDHCRRHPSDAARLAKLLK